MRLPLLLLIAFGLINCSQSDDAHTRAEAERTKEEAHQTAEKLKVESKEALHEAAIDAHKAGREIDEGLDKARVRTRQAINNATADHETDRRDRTDTSRP